jgi:hypothetical protein
METTAEVRRVSTVQLQKDRIIAAYKNNILLPEVSLADHTTRKPIDVVGEDGQAMTRERRVALMKGRPVGIVDGDIRTDVDFTKVAVDITPEPYCASADARKESIRLVQPKEAKVTLEVDLGVPSDLEAATFSTMPCCWSSGQDLVGDIAGLHKYCGEAIAALKSACGGAGPAEVHTARDTMFAVEALITRKPTQPAEGMQFQGVPIRYNESLGNELRFYAGNDCPGMSRRYASVFVHRDLISLYTINPGDPL